MNDSPRGEPDQASKPRALIMEFITEVNRDLQRLREGNADLVAMNPTSWRRLQTAAHNIGARAGRLELQVLQVCARELEQFAMEVLTPTASDRSRSIEGAMVALEMLDLELHALQRDLESRSR
jgi:phage shock protein A